tara:strand:+ start:707 stop:868 length:162 start_codon:yes stop_codon:yes gene_type:complete
MTLTADEIMRIWKVARLRAAGYKIDYSRTVQEQKDALADIEDIMEAEQEDGLG